MTVLKAMGLALAVALMLPLAASCGGSDEPRPPAGGTGGTQPTGGTGGTQPADPVQTTINSLCGKFDECNSLPQFFELFGREPASEQECRNLLNECLDQNYPLDKLDWSTVTDPCLELQNCGNVFACYANNGLLC